MNSCQHNDNNRQQQQQQCGIKCMASLLLQTESSAPWARIRAVAIFYASKFAFHQTNMADDISPCPQCTVVPAAGALQCEVCGYAFGDIPGKVTPVCFLRSLLFQSAAAACCCRLCNWVWSLLTSYRTQCPQCTVVNEPDAPVCSVCGYSFGGDDSITVSSKREATCLAPRLISFAVPSMYVQEPTGVGLLQCVLSTFWRRRRTSASAPWTMPDLYLRQRGGCRCVRSVRCPPGVSRGRCREQGDQIASRCS